MGIGSLRRYREVLEHVAVTSAEDLLKEEAARLEAEKAQQEAAAKSAKKSKAEPKAE